MNDRRQNRPMTESTCKQRTVPINRSMIGRRTDAGEGACVSDDFRFRLREEWERLASERLGAKEAESHSEWRAQSARVRVS